MPNSLSAVASFAPTPVSTVRSSALPPRGASSRCGLGPEISGSAAGFASATAGLGEAAFFAVGAERFAIYWAAPGMAGALRDADVVFFGLIVGATRAASTSLAAPARPMACQNPVGAVRPIFQACIVAVPAKAVL